MFNNFHIRSFSKGKYLIFSKLRPRKLCYGLTAKEFKCRCDYEHCKCTIINEELIEAFETFRLFIDTPIVVTSGYRCSAHNMDIGGKSVSQHQAGRAIDILYKNIEEVYTISTTIYIAKQSGFNYVKYYSDERFFHLAI